MDNYEIPPSDVSKLTAESLQLRNQQFFIATLALTGMGLSSFFLTEFSIENAADPRFAILKLMIIFITWLTLLRFLFRWSLNLHRLITIISEFQKYTKVSEDSSVPSAWEDWYYQLPRNEHDFEKYVEVVKKYPHIPKEVKNELETMEINKPLFGWSSFQRGLKSLHTGHLFRFSSITVESQTAIALKAHLLYGFIAFFIVLSTLFEALGNDTLTNVVGFNLAIYGSICLCLLSLLWYYYEQVKNREQLAVDYIFFRKLIANFQYIKWKKIEGAE